MASWTCCTCREEKRSSSHGNRCGEKKNYFVLCRALLVPSCFPVNSIISINISLNTLTMNYGRNKHTHFRKNKLHTLTFICMYEHIWLCFAISSVWNDWRIYRADFFCSSSGPRLYVYIEHVYPSVRETKRRTWTSFSRSSEIKVNLWIVPRIHLTSQWFVRN